MANCTACYGSGNVTAITGQLRPCSRCRNDDFTDWYLACLLAQQKREAAKEQGDG